MKFSSVVLLSATTASAAAQEVTSTTSVFVPVDARRAPVLEASVVYAYPNTTRYVLGCPAERNTRDPGACDMMKSAEVVVTNQTIVNWSVDRTFFTTTRFENATVTRTADSGETVFVSFITATTSQSFFMTFRATLDPAQDTATATGRWGYDNRTFDPFRNHAGFYGLDSDFPGTFRSVNASMLPVTITAGAEKLPTPTTARTTTSSSTGGAAMPAVTRQAVLAGAAVLVGGVMLGV